MVGIQDDFQLVDRSLVMDAHAWSSTAPLFQVWYRDLVAAGNRLDDAEVLWTFHIPQANNVVFCFAVRVKVWVTAEKRHKENEFIVSRADISTICAYFPDARSHEMLDTKIVLVRESRSPGRTADGFLHDLPGGSSFHPKEDALEVANELQDETGVEIKTNRFRRVAVRQLAATFGTHKGHLFAVELTAEEVRHMEALEQIGDSFGVAADTEKTCIEVRTVRQILSQELLDHACIGMILQSCLLPCIAK